MRSLVANQAAAHDDFLTRPKPLLGRVLVIGSSKKKKQEELFINFQPIVSKCCASEVQCSLKCSPKHMGPELSTWAPNRAPGPQTEHLGPEPSIWALKTAPNLAPGTPNRAHGP